MAEDKIFADGFIFKKRETSPDWVIGNLSVKVDEAIAFIKNHEKNGWVNLNINQSQGGKYYVQLDTFVPKAKEAVAKEEEDDTPF